MTVIRLSRMGRNKRPFYRIVVTDSRKRRDSGWIENIGYYNPVSSPKELKIDEERLEYWIGVGAKMSEKVQRLTGKISSKNLAKKLASNTPKKKTQKEIDAEEAAKAKAEEEKAATAAAAQEQAEPKEEAPAQEVANDSEATTEAPKEEDKE